MFTSGLVILHARACHVRGPACIEPPCLFEVKGCCVVTKSESLFATQQIGDENSILQKESSNLRHDANWKD